LLQAVSRASDPRNDDSALGFRPCVVHDKVISSSFHTSLKVPNTPTHIAQTTFDTTSAQFWPAQHVHYQLKSPIQAIGAGD
jgi:hypothetical protein